MTAYIYISIVSRQITVDLQLVEVVIKEKCFSEIWKLDVNLFIPDAFPVKVITTICAFRFEEEDQVEVTVCHLSDHFQFASKQEDVYNVNKLATSLHMSMAAIYME